MEQRAWAYVVSGADGGFRVGAHQGRDLESHIGRTLGTARERAILWADTFRSPDDARAFARRFRRWSYRRQAQWVIGEQMAA